MLWLRKSTVFLLYQYKTDKQRRFSFAAMCTALLPAAFKLYRQCGNRALVNSEGIFWLWVSAFCRRDDHAFAGGTTSAYSTGVKKGKRQQLAREPMHAEKRSAQWREPCTLVRYFKPPTCCQHESVQHFNRLGTLVRSAYQRDRQHGGWISFLIFCSAASSSNPAVA